MNPNERKKMEKSAGKIGVNLKGESLVTKDAPSKGNTRGRSKGKSKGKGSKKIRHCQAPLQIYENDKANALLSKHVAAGSATIPLDNAKGKALK